MCLYASEAFDRVLHMKLFEKLIQRKVPMCFVRILKHWYKEQTMQIKWRKNFSEPFNVSNGRPQKFSRGVQSRHFGYLSQVVGDATKWTYTKNKCPMLRQQLHTVFSL